jgi:catechol 2,3-dioxygenase-like lactoylglutathione lyase family enzyme
LWEIEMPPKPRGIAPHFLVEDVMRAAEYYRDKLGFEIGPYFLDPPVFVIIQRDGMAIQLSRMEGGRGGSNRKWKNEAVDAYIWVADVDRLHREVAAAQATILQAPLLKEYGMKEMDVADPDGYVIRFGEDVPS